MKWKRFVLPALIALVLSPTLKAQTTPAPSACSPPITNCGACRTELGGDQTTCVNTQDAIKCALCVLKLTAYCIDCGEGPNDPPGICDDSEAGENIRKAFCYTGKPVFSDFPELGTY